MSKSKLWIVVSENGLKSYQTLDDAVSPFDDLAQFVVSESRIVCLAYDPKSEGSWELDTVGIQEIAKTVLKRMEK